MDPATYFLPFELFVPFINLHHMTGFIVMVIIQMFTAYSYALAMITTIMYFVSCCYYIEACCLDCKQTFDDINGKLQTSRKTKNTNEIKKLLKISIRQHIEIME